MQHQPPKKPKKEKLYCRSWAADYLGVTSNALKNYPVPYVQYSRFGYALYRLQDLQAFKEKSIKVPSGKGGVCEVAT